MTSASEVFVVELSRVSRRANRVIGHLQRSDRDDVIAAALAWCWENRAQYSLTTTLETWFMNAVRDAYKKWSRGEIKHAAETLEQIPTANTTEAAASAVSSADALILSLPREYKKVARLEMEGWTRAEMKAAGISHRVIDEARRRIKQLRKLLTDEQDFRRVLRAYRAPSDSAIHEYEDGKAHTHQPQIDKEIEALDFPPPGAKECPPCWRCMWFEGWLPGEHRSVRMPIVEPDIAKAVADTEARKVTIAKRVRGYGNV